VTPGSKPQGQRRAPLAGIRVLDLSSIIAAPVTATLFERERNGGDGQMIDLALFEAGFRASEDALMRYSVTGAVRERSGNVNPHVVPAAILSGC